MIENYQGLSFHPAWNAISAHTPPASETFCETCSGDPRDERALFERMGRNGCEFIQRVGNRYYFKRKVTGQSGSA